MLTTNYLLTILLTLVIEVIAAFIFGYRSKTILISIVFINLITNPILNYILWLNSFFWFFRTTIVNIFFLESIVVLVECFLLAFTLRRNFKLLLPLSLAMNFASFMAGLIFLR